MSEEKMLEEVRESVDSAKAQGTFNIINLLNERAYPKEKITVYLNEDAAYRASSIRDSIKNYKGEADGLTELEDALDLATKQMIESGITFNIIGITEGKRDALLADARKTYPVEYSRELNAMTGEMVKEEKDSPERDNLFTDYLWLASIDNIVDAKGNVQSDLNYGIIRDMRQMLPLAATAKVSEAIEKMRISTALFMAEVNEDFLQKS